MSARTYTLTQRQIADLVGDNCIGEAGEDRGPLDSLALMCSTVDAAVTELRVLSGSVNDENVRPEHVEMMLCRLANRLDAVSDLVWTLEWKRRRESSEGSDAPPEKARATLEAQAQSDVDTALALPEEHPLPLKPAEWFRSWLDGECDCVLGGLAEDEAFTIYETAFHEAIGKRGSNGASTESEADHA